MLSLFSLIVKVCSGQLSILALLCKMAKTLCLHMNTWGRSHLNRPGRVGGRSGSKVFKFRAKLILLALHCWNKMEFTFINYAILTCHLSDLPCIPFTGCFLKYLFLNLPRLVHFIMWLGTLWEQLKSPLPRSAKVFFKKIIGSFNSDSLLTLGFLQK